MLTWIAMNIGTIIISLFLILIVTGIIYSLIRDKQKGRSICSCGGNCGHCKACAAGHSK